MSEKTAKIVYTEADEKGLELIGGLWQKLHDYHRERNKYFPEYYAMMTWQKRKKEILEKSAKGKFHLDLGWEVDTGKIIGYCISTISESGVGEVDSIFIEEPYRRSRIGDNFMKKALKWMNGESVMWKMLTVAGGNEEVFGFYSRYGFFPRFTMLAQTKTDS
ncbi:MAG: GNAT family N-acetyltransferase [Dehalococcoidales bacterium]